MSTEPHRKRCPGCTHPIARTGLWCGPCERRMPRHLMQAIADARAATDSAIAAALTWLGGHPHATARELRVVALVAQGLPNADIADRLACNEDQVKDALRQLTRRWGCTGRAHVVATAFRLGYLTVDIPKGLVAS